MTEEDNDNEYEKEINPVLKNLRHSKKPSNGIESESHESSNDNKETGEPLQTKKDRINILKKIKNDIDETKKKNEQQERSNDILSLPIPNKRLSEKESIMQRLIEAKKKKMEINEHYQGNNANQSDDEKEEQKAKQKTKEKDKDKGVDNEKIEKLKNLFMSKKEKIEVEEPNEDKEKETKDEVEEEEDNEKIEREKIKQKLLKLALEKKQLKEQANLSFNKIDSNDTKTVKEERKGNEDEAEEDINNNKEREKENKKVLLAKLVSKHNKQTELPIEKIEEKNKRNSSETNTTNELKNIIEMMKNKKKEEEQKRKGLNEEDVNDENEDDDDEKDNEEDEIKKNREMLNKKLEEDKRIKEKERERIEKERLERERIEKERLERERIEKERLERERLDAEKKEKERLERERLEQERIENDRLEKERLKLELEKERLERERLEAEKKEKDRLEKERQRKQEEIRKKEEEKQKRIFELEQIKKKEKEKEEKEFKEKALQEELQKQKAFEEERERMKQKEITLQREIEELKQKVQQKELEKENELRRYQNIEYQKELEFQKQLEKETQKQKEQQQQQLQQLQKRHPYSNQKQKSGIDNISYQENEDEDTRNASQSHHSSSSKLIYNPKKPGIRGKSVDKLQDISVHVNNKSQFNSNNYSLVTNYNYNNNDSISQYELPLNTNGNNTGYNSSINLLSNFSSSHVPGACPSPSPSNNSSVYAKAPPIYTRSPRRYVPNNNTPTQHMNKSPTASYVYSQYTQSPIPYQQLQQQQYKKDQAELSINLEDLLLLEEKLSDIIISLNANKQTSNECFEWWNFFFNCSLYNRIEKTFKAESARNLITATNKLQLLSIIICYDMSFDPIALNKNPIMLKSILKLHHRNFMIICEHILSKISKDSLDNLWVYKLRNVVNFNSNKNSDENFKQFFDCTSDELINEIQYNLKIISDYIRIILKNYLNKNLIEILTALYWSIHKKTYEEINVIFREKIMRVENRNASVLASVLIRDNFKFLSVPTPYLTKPNLKKYTLVLDLDETLIHFKVNQDDDTQGTLLERPGLKDFLETVGNYYELIIFTAAIQDYADPIINAIEEKRLYFDYRLYRQHAVIIDNDFVKDLTRLGRPIDKMIIVDNMPQNFRLQKENGIYIRAFWGEDQSDTALIDLMPILINIAFEGGDVRVGLSKYRDEIVRKVTSNISRNSK